MRKFFEFILISCLLAVFVLSPISVSAATEKAITDYDTYLVLADFLGNNPIRETGKEGEANAARYLQEKMQSYGYNPQLQEFSFFSNDSELTSANVVAKKLSKTTNAKNVVLGAHYDCVTNGDGALDNGTGVATLLVIAKQIYSAELPFDLTIVFFGAEELGLYGSEYYVNQLTETEKQNTLIMINLDCVAAGDYLYLYTEDLPTKYEKFFLSNTSASYGKTIQSMPLSKRATMLLSGYPNKPYYHVGQASDHSSFRAKGIPTAFYFAGNLSSNKFGYVESQENGSNMHTQNDTLEYLVQKYGVDLALQMETVASSVLAVLNNSSFLSEVSIARNQLVPNWLTKLLYPTLVLCVILAVCCYFCIRTHKKLVKESMLNDDNQPAKKERIIKKPADTDIFTYRK